MAHDAVVKTDKKTDGRGWGDKRYKSSTLDSLHIATFRIRTNIPCEDVILVDVDWGLQHEVAPQHSAARVTSGRVPAAPRALQESLPSSDPPLVPMSLDRVGW